MRIQLDENKYIVSYAVVGDVNNSIEVDFGVEAFNGLPCFLYKYENGSLTLDEEKKTVYLKEQENLSQIENIQLQIDELNLWMAGYDEKYKEYERCQRFGLEFEGDIDELNNQASEKQSLLTNLKNQLKMLK